MDALITAVRTKLLTNSAITSGVSAVCSFPAPVGTVYPYIGLTLIPGGLTRIFSGIAFKEYTLDVEAVDLDTVSTTADALASEIEESLEDATLTVTGHTVHACLQTDDIIRDEDNAGTPLRRRGRSYRIWIN